MLLFKSVRDHHLSENYWLFISFHFTISVGFLRSRSTLQQLLIFFQSVLYSLDNRLQVDFVYRDISKVFDSVSHNKLIYKLWTHFGITNSVWKWFKAYFLCRKQTVSINHCRLIFHPVLSGFPQGSILGPLLFIFYINELPSLAHLSNIILFADDTKCYRSISFVSDSFLLQSDLNDLSDWCYD